MYCKICASKAKDYKKICKGKICLNCYDKLPECVKHNIRNFTFEEIRYVKRKFHTLDQFVKMDSNCSWIEYNNIGLSLIGIVLEKKYILLFKDLQQVSFSFIPRKTINDKLCFGELCFQFSFIGFPYKFSTLIAEGSLEYKFSKDLFTPIFPTIINTLSKFIHKGIVGYSLEEEKVKYSRYQEKYKSWQEDYKREQQEKEQREKTYNSDSSRCRKTSNDSLQNALEFFHLHIPFTERELKSIYHEYIRKCHPDQSQVAAELNAKQVNEYYTLLKKYTNG